MLELQLTDPFILTGLSFLGGLTAAAISKIFLKASHSMVLTSMILPSVVCAALLAINGSLGTGIAILGVFGLVRFRSMPGSGTDIVTVFYCMVIGLLFSTGYVISAAGLTVLVGLIIIVACFIMSKQPPVYLVRIIVPEDMEDYAQFTSILRSYGKNVELLRVRTTNMGSMVELEYSFELTADDTARMLEEIRVRNHNLNVSLSNVKPDGSGL